MKQQFNQYCGIVIWLEQDKGVHLNKIQSCKNLLLIYPIIKAKMQIRALHLR